MGRHTRDGCHGLEIFCFFRFAIREEGVRNVRLDLVAAGRSKGGTGVRQAAQLYTQGEFDSSWYYCLIYPCESLKVFICSRKRRGSNHLH